MSAFFKLWQYPLNVILTCMHSLSAQIHDDLPTACYNVENLCYIFGIIENIVVNWNDDSAALVEGNIFLLFLDLVVHISDTT